MTSRGKISFVAIIEQHKDMNAHPKAGRFFESLSYTDKKEFIRWIEMTKNPDTRERKMKIFLEKLLDNKKLFEK